MPLRRVFVVMCADLFHCGHVAFLKQCKGLYDDVFLIVGLRDDETMATYKRRPIMTLEERRIVVEACRYVDCVVTHVPLSLTTDYLTRHAIDIVVHGDGISTEEVRQKYGVAVDLGKYLHVPRTPGISTTAILARMRYRP